MADSRQSRLMSDGRCEVRSARCEVRDSRMTSVLSRYVECQIHTVAWSLRNDCLIAKYGSVDISIEYTYTKLRAERVRECESSP
jgi:hypothetical protein